MSFDHAAERARARLHSRVFSYRAIFLRPQANEPPARWWQRAFWTTPRGGDLGPAAEVVLRDLARYCYANRPTLKVSNITQQSDALAMAFAEGRRDVFNRITALCNLSADQISTIINNRSANDD